MEGGGHRRWLQRLASAQTAPVGLESLLPLPLRAWAAGDLPEQLRQLIRLPRLCEGGVLLEKFLLPAKGGMIGM